MFFLPERFYWMYIGARMVCAQGKNKVGPFGCVEWGQRSAVMPSYSGVISERCVQQKPVEDNWTCFYLRVQIQSRLRVNKWI